MAVTESASLGRLKLRNRLVRSATWEGLCSDEGRIPSEIYEIYKELADGGVGLIITGLTDVCPYDIGLKGNMRLVSDDVIPDYKALTDLVHERGARILCQLNINRYTRENGDMIGENLMTEDDFLKTVNYFRDGALRAQRAGFDGIQLHLAYSWLLSRILDPNYNHRADGYGGSTENRCRIVLDIISEIRRVAPELHVSAKLSFWHKGEEFDTEECSAVVRLISSRLDSIELLGEGSELEEDMHSDSIYLPLIEQIISEISCPVILTGNNRDIGEMERLNAEHGISAFGLCRALICESDLPRKFLEGASTRSKCRACGGCNKTLGSRCIFNVMKI